MTDGWRRSVCRSHAHAAAHVSGAGWWWCRLRSGGKPGGARAHRARVPVIRGRDAGRADAAALRDRGGRRARQDDDDFDDCARAFGRAGLDPTAVIGGRLRAFGSNARLGRAN